MSDLANCCEYLTVEKSCAAAKESEKATANRERQCQNGDKTACCYLCLLRPECSISCKYLGQTTALPTPAETPEIGAESTPNEDEEAKVSQAEDAPVVCCSLCSVEMSQTKTELKVEGWKGQPPGCGAGGVLPVVVYLCPRCGKIEFRADAGQQK